MRSTSKIVGGTSTKPWWLSSRQSLPPYRTRGDSCHCAHRLVPLIRVCPAVHSAALAALHYWRLARPPGPASGPTSLGHLKQRQFLQPRLGQRGGPSASNSITGSFSITPCAPSGEPRTHGRYPAPGGHPTPVSVSRAGLGPVNAKRVYRLMRPKARHRAVTFGGPDNTARSSVHQASGDGAQWQRLDPEGRG
jgi:hypothetical protein